MEGIQSILDKKSDDPFDDAIEMVSSGTPLREAIELINAAQNGALLCIGDVDHVLDLGGGGFRIDVPFTPQRLYELSKMDGAILLSENAKKIVRANFHLSPDPNIPTSETGMRYRSASRTSAATEALVIAISERRHQISLYRNGEGLTLDSDEILLQKCNQGLMSLQNSRNNLERASVRLSFLEMDDISTVADVTEVLFRYIHIFKLAIETKRFIDFLGDNSWLLQNQLDEIVRGLADSYLLIIRDYAISDDIDEVRLIAKSLPEHASDDKSGDIMRLLGYSEVPADKEQLLPRGFRTISRISMLDEEAVARIIDEYGSLQAVISDSRDGFDNRMEDLGIANVRALAKSFMQLRSVI